MATRPIDQQIARLTGSLGSDVARFAEYAAGEMWQACHRHALAMGMTPAEAEGIARLTVTAAVKTMAGAVKQARFERNFRRRS